ncbi:MAG: hypothetical protein WC241_04840 [Candidatus Paceibacterota bacterium]
MVRKNGYFVTSETIAEAIAKHIEYSEYDRYLFRKFNGQNTNPTGHSANKILRYHVIGHSPYAIRCNCGTHHPVSFDGAKNFVNWDISIEGKTPTVVLEKIKELIRNTI